MQLATNVDAHEVELMKGSRDSSRKTFRDCGQYAPNKRTCLPLNCSLRKPRASGGLNAAITMTIETVCVLSYCKSTHRHVISEVGCQNFISIR